MNHSTAAIKFAESAERITNNALLDEWIALYHPEATAEWVFDGARDVHAGIAEISAAATELAHVWKKYGLTVRKRVECADANTVVLSWTGGFGSRDTQIGTEIWTLSDGLVIEHRVYGHLNIHSSTRFIAQLRLAIAAPRIALEIAYRRLAERSG